MGWWCSCETSPNKRKMEAFQQELIASFSHELRTPLANIGTITQMLLVEDEVVAARQEVRELLHLLEDQSKRLEEFAERFLTLSQLESKELPLELRPVAMNLLVQTAVRQWQTLQPERPVSFAAPAQPQWAWADEQAVRTVIEVLLDNAGKYTLPDAPVEVRVFIGLTGPGYRCGSRQRPGTCAQRPIAHLRTILSGGQQ